MTKYLVDDSSLEAVADAIRGKTKQNDPLLFPTEFVSSIQSIGYSDIPENDGKTHFVIEIPENVSSELRVAVINVADGSNLIVDWGDGDIEDLSEISYTLPLRHLYSNYGTYDIVLTRIDPAVNVTLGNVYPRNTLSPIFGSFEPNKSESLNSIESNTLRNYLKAFCGFDSGVSISTNSTAFKNQYNLKYVYLGLNLTYLYSSSFSGCFSLKEMFLPSSLTMIYSNCFSSCNSLVTLIIPSSVRKIYSGAFNYCNSLKEISFPSSISTIESDLLSNCTSLVDVDIPEGVTTINDRAFSNCFSIPKITLPSTITEMGNYIFYGCYSLSEIHVKSYDPPTITSSSFNSVYGRAKIYVPKNRFSAYLSDSNWSSLEDGLYEEPD